MNIFTAIFLGALQGLTEFLPVSSSGHLVIAQSFIPGFSQPGVLFDVVLHLGTTVAVLMYFYKRLLSHHISYYLLLAIGSVPAALVGIFFQEPIEVFFSSTTIVGVALIVTGILNYFTDRAQAERRALTVFDALWVGGAQAFAIIPGISRSGSTIFAGTTAGVDRKTAAEFSFLLSVPAIVGASLLQLVTLEEGVKVELLPYLGGFVASFLVGLLAIHTVLRLLSSQRFVVFSVYCIAFGAAVLIFRVL